MIAWLALALLLVASPAAAQIFNPADPGDSGVNAQDGTAADSTAGSQAGSAGAAYGSGGGGGAVLNTATGVAGGQGAHGFVIVIEFL